MRLVILVLLLCAGAQTADTPALRLFEKVRGKVLANVDKVPRYTCVETITRTVRRPQYGSRPKSCAAVAEARTHLNSKPSLIWHDRLRVDVAVADGGEMFSWAGASKFETENLEELAGGGTTGSGAFGSFLSSIFGNDVERFTYRGTEDDLAVFDYIVPLRRSHYTYRMKNGTNRVIPYTGSFYVSPGAADLKRLVVLANEFPANEACQVEDTMDYQTRRIGAGEFLLPEVSRMVVMQEQGDIAENETRFANCHEYVGESTIRFGDDSDAASAAVAAKEALRELSGHTRIRVHFDPPVDSDTASAGDAVIGVVEHEVKEGRKVVVRMSDRLHGRILKIEQFLAPVAQWNLVIRFESIERDGVDQPVKFLPLDDAVSQSRVSSMRRNQPPLPRKPEALFVFPTPGKLMLGEKFHTEWEVTR